MRLVVTLGLLVGLTWLTLEVATPELVNGRLAIFLGFVLLAASVAASLAAEVGLPRITGFIVIGNILAGPILLGRALAAPRADAEGEAG